MSALPRFEIARTDAGPQPWHARLIVNGRITWRVENLTRQVGAERAILSLARAFGFYHVDLIWNVEGVEKVFFDPFRGNVVSHLPTVRYVDERAVS